MQWATAVGLEKCDREQINQLQRPLYRRTDGTAGGAGQYYCTGR